MNRPKYSFVTTWKLFQNCILQKTDMRTFIWEKMNDHMRHFSFEWFLPFTLDKGPFNCNTDFSIWTKFSNFRLSNINFSKFSIWSTALYDWIQDQFQFGWLNIKGFVTSFPISITLFINHLKWNSSKPILFQNFEIEFLICQELKWWEIISARTIRTCLYHFDIGSNIIEFLFWM